MSTWTATIASDSRTDEIEYIEVEADSKREAMDKVYEARPGFEILDIINA